MNAPLQIPSLFDWKDSAANRQDAGGKGWQLGLLARYGLPVPDGFVIPASICRSVLNAAGVYARIAHAVDVQEDVLARCRADIAACSLPDEFTAQLRSELKRRGWTDIALAVRSSATTEDSEKASFAGIHLSRLNVRGIDALTTAIRDVWASLWTPQAAAYRARFNIAAGEAAMAVVVMPLLPAVAAGIAFSCDPRSGRDDQIILHAHWGLGESLVSGEADGDEYRLQEDVLDTRLTLVERSMGGKARRTVLRPDGGTQTADTSFGERVQQVLTDEQAVELGELVRDAAFALDFARPFYDVEWVWDGNRFWIVQARPVTVMARNTYAAIANQPTIWSNGNTRDVAPLPQSALDWSMSRRLVNMILEQSRLYAGYPLLPGAQRVALFNGRLYLNLSLMMWEAWDGFGVTPKVISRMVGGYQPEIVVPPARLRDRLRRLPRLIQYVIKVLPIRRKAERLADGLRALARAWEQESLQDETQACHDLLFSRIRIVVSQRELGLLQGSGGASLSMLIEKLERYVPGQSYMLIASLLAGGKRSVTAQQSYELAALAELASSDPALCTWLSSADRDDEAWRTLPDAHPFRRRFMEFLQKYGHRGVYESYLRHPRWRDAPGYLLDSITGLIGVNMTPMHIRQQQARDNAWRTIRAALPWHARIGMKTMLANANHECNQRELARSTFTRLSAACRPLLLHIGSRMVAHGPLLQAEHIFELTLNEIGLALHGRIPAAGIAARVADRLALRAYWENNHAPDVIYEGASQEATVESEQVGVESGSWHGVAVGTGIARGIARVIRHPDEGKRLAQGEILVAPSTDPAWTPLFLKAGGLVMETGGYLSHGAIVAREFAVPAVVNVPGILDKVRDGDLLEVDGGTGRVTLLRETENEETDSVAFG